MSYKSTRRQWVKLWVNEWLDGTTRFELTAPQRLLWVDLLALAGRSRFPGYVYAGEGAESAKVGYPLAYLAGVLQMDEVALNNALKLLELHGHITLSETGSEQYVIGIVNWEKYQSEYLRQKTYRRVTTQTTSRLPVEGEVEVEVEGEKKKTTTRFALPVWVSKEPWEQFIKTRRNPTARTKELLLRKLQHLKEQGYDPTQIIELATERGWKSFFPEKGAVPLGGKVESIAAGVRYCRCGRTASGHNLLKKHPERWKESSFDGHEFEETCQLG